MKKEKTGITDIPKQTINKRKTRETSNKNIEQTADKRNTKKRSQENTEETERERKERRKTK